MNVMLVSVSERTREIGLLKAVGVTRPPDRRGLPGRGGHPLDGRAASSGLGRGLRRGRGLLRGLYPSFPAQPPVWAVGAAIARLDLGRSRLRRAPGAARGAARSGRGPGAAMSARGRGKLSALAWGAVAAHRLRSVLTMLGIVIGIASVILLTSLGEGTRRYIVEEFTQFGTNILSINKGKATTSGMPGLSADGPQAHDRGRRGVAARAGASRVVLPGAFGTARVEAGERGRGVLVYGVTSEMPRVFRSSACGRAASCRRATRAAGARWRSSGPKLKHELFGEANPLGRARADRRTALPRHRRHGAEGPDPRLRHGRPGLHPGRERAEPLQPDELTEIDVLFSSEIPAARIKARRAPGPHGAPRRRGGLHDHDARPRCSTCSAASSRSSASPSRASARSRCVVGAIGILTMMWISVGERTGEIGLLRAIGATRRQVLRLFLVEAVMLSAAGGVVGVARGVRARRPDSRLRARPAPRHDPGLSWSPRSR